MADLRQEFPHVKATAFPISIAPAYHKIRYTDDEMLKLIITPTQNGSSRNSISSYMYYPFLCVSNKVKINNDMSIYVKLHRDLIIQKLLLSQSSHVSLT